MQLLYFSNQVGNSQPVYRVNSVGRKFRDLYSLGTLLLRTLERGFWMLQLFTHQFWKIILNLHYTASKFAFWMRVRGHGKTWCWKPSEDSQGLRFRRNRRKAASKPPLPTSSESHMFHLFPAVSLPFVLHRAEPAKIKKGFVLSASSLNTSENMYWSPTVCQALFWKSQHWPNEDPLDRVLSTVSQHWEQCQAHSRCSVNTCGVDLNRSGQSAGGHHGPCIPGWEMLEKTDS